MWPPLLLGQRPLLSQAVIGLVSPTAFGALCGFLLGTSALGFRVLTTAVPDLAKQLGIERQVALAAVREMADSGHIVIEGPRGARVVRCVGVWDDAGGLQ